MPEGSGSFLKSTRLRRKLPDPSISYVDYINLRFRIQWFNDPVVISRREKDGILRVKKISI